MTNLEHVAVLLPTLGGGGTERMRLRLAGDWVARGIRVDLVLLKRTGDLLREVPDGVNVEALEVGSYREALRPLIRYLRQCRPNVLLVGLWPLTSFAAVAARLSGTGVRVVLSEHAILSHQYSNRDFLRRGLMRASLGAAYRLADASIVISEGVQRDLAKLARMDASKFHVVHNPAAVPQLPRLDDTQRVEDEPLILSVGKLVPVKDHATLLEAFALSNASRKARLCVLGEGPLRATLESDARRLGISGRVSFPGFSLDAGAYYRKASLFVLSSRAEGFGNVIVEALQHGVPVVSTDCFGPREILQDGAFGTLVPVGRPRSMADAIDEALRRPADPSRLKQRAEAFSLPRVSDQYLAVLRGESGP